MTRTIFSKFQDKENVYRIRVNVGNLSISLIILEHMKEEVNVYKTPMILEQNLRMHSSRFRMTVENYFEKLLTYFENPSNIKFSFNKKNLTILEAVNSDFQVKYFTCDLIHVEDFPCFIGNFIDQSNQENSELERKYRDLDEKHKLLEQESNGYKEKLRELVERKKVDDDLMLGNFVLLLNEKKRKIQHLSDLLEAFRIDPSLANPVEVNVNASRKRKSMVESKKAPANIKEEVSESDSDNDSNSGYNTSDEVTVNAEPKKEITVTSQYIDDIFDESPPQPVKLPRLTQQLGETSLPSTSKVINKTKASITQNESKLSSNLCTPVVEINTQDWLDGL